MRRAVVIIRTLVVYLLVGLVLTVVIAWGLALKPAHLHTSWVHESVKLEQGYERTVDVTVEHGLGTLFACYETVELPVNVPRFSRRGAGVPPSIGSGSDDPRFEHALSWDVTGFGGWGQRRIALQEGPGSEWASGIDAASGFPFVALWCSWPATHTFGPFAGRRGDEPFEPDFSRSMLGGFPLSPETDNAYLGGRRIAKRHIPRALPYLPIWHGLALNTAFYAVLVFLAVRIAKGSRHLWRFGRGRCPACGHNLRGRFAAPCTACGRGACNGRRGEAVAA